MTDLPLAAGVPAYESAHGRAQWAMRLLGAVIALGVLALLSGSLELGFLARAATEGLSPEDAAANDTRQGLVGILQLITLVATAIVFLRWQHRAHKNLRAFQAGSLEFTPGWAVGYWFVPIMNLFRPYQAINELWKASAPDIEPGNRTAWRSLAPPSITGLWWALFLASGFLGRASFRLSTHATTLPELTTASWVTFASDAVDIVAAVCAILVVREIDRRQEAKAARRA